MFRFQDNVPQNYVNESRDFQLFLRIMDCINSGVKYDIDTIIDLFDPMKVNDRMLDLLCTKVGFYPRQKLNTNTLRYIVAAFPYLIKYKGSRRGIEGAVATILKADSIFANYSVAIINSTHAIEISIDKEFDRVALNELLRFIIPIGYISKASVAESAVFTTELDVINIVQGYIDPDVSVSQIHTFEDDFNLPTCDIRIVATGVAAADIENVSKVIATYDDRTIVTYTYFELDDTKITYNKVQLTMTIYNNDQDRYIGTMDRAMVVSYQENSISMVDDIDTNSKYHTNVEVFNDIGEQLAGEQAQVYRYAGNFNELAENISSGTEIEIKDSDYYKIVVTRGSYLAVGDILKDNNESLAKITSISTTNKTVKCIIIYLEEAKNG